MLQTLIDESVAETIRPLLNKDGTWDAVSLFAKPLPLRVILSIIGFPADDAPDMLAWADAVEDWFGGRGPPAPRFARCQTAIRAFAARAAARLAEPTLPPDGAAAALVRAAAAGRLDPGDVVPNLFFLMAAGHESSAGVLAHSLRTILRHPRRAALAAALATPPPPTLAAADDDDSRALSPAGDDAGGHGGPAGVAPDDGDEIVEELLRLVTPVARLYREVGPEGLDYAGLRFRPGEPVHLHAGAANADARAFPGPDPAEFHPGRPAGRRHLAFGAHDHVCPAARLARRVVRSALAALLAAPLALELAAPAAPARPAPVDSLNALAELLVTSRPLPAPAPAKPADPASLG